MAFKYRLEKLLNLKRIDEHRAVEKLSDCRKRYDTCNAQLTDTIDAYERLQKSLDVRQAGMTAQDFMFTSQQMNLMVEKIEHLARTIAKLDMELNECLTETSDCVSKRQAHENLREHAMSDWRHEQRRIQRRQDGCGRLSARPD